jgi:hypothetical protein
MEFYARLPDPDRISLAPKTMATPRPRNQNQIRRRVQMGIVAAACLYLGGCTTLDPEKNRLRSKFLPRWETNEVPYEEAGAFEKAGRNVRDGLINFIDCYFQGAFATFTIAPTSGYIVQKLSIMGGDVIGLIDDNEITEHAFKGIISRQFLKFGSQARDFPATLGAIHSTTIDAPERGILDYVGDKTFHTEAYGAPSAITTLGGVVLADFIIRPAGNLIMVFGFRKTADKIDEFGLDVLKASAKIPFL